MKEPEEIDEVLLKYHYTSAGQRTNTPALVREALEWSIDHWKRFETGTQYEGERPYCDDCALCQLYCANFHHNTCDGCPIMRRTGVPGCNDSPWDDAVHEYCEYKSVDGSGQSASFKRAAKKMREFLESLREDI